MLWVSFLTVQLVTADRRSEYYLISVHASRGIPVPGQKVRCVGFGTKGCRDHGLVSRGTSPTADC